jgi:ABC-type transporter Mla subunit MlaD
MALQDLTPQLRTRLSRMERAVGWFVLLATAVLVLGFGYYIYNTAARKGWFLTKAPFFTFTDRATGLKPGDPVILMGKPAGKIIKVETMDPYSPYNIYVEFELMDPNYGYMWTEGSRAKVASADFLGSRVVEVSKGTGGHAIYIFHPLEEVSRVGAETKATSGGWTVAEDIFDPSGTNRLLGALKQPLDRKQIDQIFAGDRTSVMVANTNLAHKITGVWNNTAGRYDSFTKDTKPYWLASDESPAVTERLERVVDQVEKALPNFLRLTNELGAILANTATATSNFASIASNTVPTSQHLAQLSAQLRGVGALGAWILPPGGPEQLASTLTNANSLVANTDTNLNLLVFELSRSLDSLANITSNLNSQVQANTNIVTSVSDIIVHTDELVQGLKRHWLLRSAFKTPKTNAPPAEKDGVLRAPNDPFRTGRPR